MLDMPKPGEVWEYRTAFERVLVGPMVSESTGGVEFLPAGGGPHRRSMELFRELFHRCDPQPEVICTRLKDGTKWRIEVAGGDFIGVGQVTPEGPRDPERETWNHDPFEFFKLYAPDGYGPPMPHATPGTPMSVLAVNQRWSTPGAHARIMTIQSIDESGLLCVDEQGRRWGMDTGKFRDAYPVQVDPTGAPMSPPPKPAAPTFAPGDVVVLRSGGMRMTVGNAINDSTAVCVWHDETGVLHSEQILTVLLKPFDEAEWAQR